jgi:Uncharacterized protein conserved in bacteria
MTLLMLCITVFCCRLFDVTLATIRMMFTVRGKPHLAALCGFVECFMWFMVVREALNSAEDGIFIGIAYAAGFATGTYIGGKISHKFIKSNLEVHAITSGQNSALIDEIRHAGYGVSVLNVNASEFSAEKYLLIMEIDNRQLDELKKLIYNIDPGAFVSVRETRYVFNGHFRKRK